MYERKPKGTLFGYRYQNLIGVSRLVDLLDNKADIVYLETKSSQSDRFDDMKVHVGNQLHHYQIKSSYVNNKLKLIDFTSGKYLDLSNLFVSWKELRQEFPNKKMFYHVYTTKSIGTNDPLKKFVKKDLPENTMFCENTLDVYHLKPEILEHAKFKKIKKSLADDAKHKTEIKQFLDTIILETNQPSYPTQIAPDRQIQGELEKTIIHKISNLGLSKSPNYIKDTTVFTYLLNLVNRDSIAPNPIRRNSLESHLKITKNFGAIKNRIEFDESLYVDAGANLKHLNEQVTRRAGSILGVKGKPGSGKTWLLTKWLEDFKQANRNTPPIWYYSSISVTGDADFEKRITKNQILRNLVSAIKTAYHITTGTNQYAADDGSFKELLDKLNEIAKKAHKVIPVIVDGLDHVHRIKKRTGPTTGSEETVMDFLNEIDIPKHICFIFGTQEGTHLDKLKEKFGSEAFYEICGFTKNETNSYLSKLAIPKKFVTCENVKLIFQKTSGLPLLVSYFGQQLKIEQDVEKIKNIPITQGNVKEYYKYLWANIDSPTNSRAFARYFSLLEFPIEAEFLESIRPKDERDGEELDACLNALQFFLRENQRGEMSIFHDSFKEFILSEQSFCDDLQIRYSKKIHDVLTKEDSFLNARTFRYALKYGLKSKQLDELINAVNLEFVDKAMINLCNEADLHNNILYAIRAATEKEDIIALLEKSLLKRYTIDRYQHLNGANYRSLILQLWPDRVFQILVTEDRLNLSLDDTVWFLGEGLNRGIGLPYSSIIRIWSDAWESAKFDMARRHHVEISATHYGLLLFHERGITHVASWISRSGFSLEVAMSIFEMILPFTTYDDIVLLENCSSVQEYWPTLHLFASFYYKKHEQFQDRFRKSVQDDTIPYFCKLGDFLKESKIAHNDLSHLIRRIDLSTSGRRHVDVKDLQKYGHQILLNSYCRNTTCLKEYEGEIEQNKSRFFYQIVNLVYQYSKMSQKDDSELTKDDAKKLLNSLSEFINYDSHKLLAESSFYDQSFYLYISNIIEKTIKIIVTNADLKIKMQLIEAIEKIGHKGAFTSLTLDNAYEMILKHSDAELKRLLIRRISHEIHTADTQAMVDQCFDKAQLLLQAGDQLSARKFFDKGIKLTFSYGYRKDFLLDEFHEISFLLGGGNYLQRAKKSLDLTEYVDTITDGDYTSSVILAIVNDTARIHSGAGYEIALKYGTDSYVFKESVVGFVKNCSKCPILIRYFLAKTRIIVNHATAHSSSTAFEIRHDLIQECIDNNNIALAKFLLDDLRIEIMRDFPQKTALMEVKFNQIARRLGLETVELGLKEAPNGAEQSDSDRNVDYSHLSPEKAIQLFERHDGWSSWQDGFVDNILESLYFKDKEKTEKLIVKSLSSVCVSYRHEPQRAVRRLGKYLLTTNQIEKLNVLYKQTDLFIDDLFRERFLNIKKDFGFLGTFVREDNQTSTGCKYIVAQLTSHDIDVQRRAFTSIVNCVRHESPELLEHCIEVVLSEDTDAALKAKLAAVIHSYVTTNKDASVKIVSCARRLCLINDRRLVTSGMGILHELGVA